MYHVSCSLLSVVMCCIRAAGTPGDSDLTTPQLIAKYGYAVEVHTVVSQGYLLQLHRIPYGREGPGDAVRSPVIINHALLCSSFNWVAMGPDKSLGFILADAGFDVWLLNYRGNTYSRKHVTLDPSDRRFWNFSVDNIGVYDVPTQIDYILATTGQAKLFYIGHSLGTTIFFITMSLRPEYNNKIRAMIALAPTTSGSNNTSPLLEFLRSAAAGLWKTILSVAGVEELLPSNTILRPLMMVMCAEASFTQQFCIAALLAITGYSDQMDKSRLPVLLAHTPAGTSTTLFRHVGQVVLTGRFARYDFGPEKNVEVYGQDPPPLYDLEKVTVPVSLHYSDNDLISTPHIVDIVSKELPNVIGKFRVSQTPFNHVDFMWGKEANVLVYGDVLKVLKKYETT